MVILGIMNWNEINILKINSYYLNNFMQIHNRCSKNGFTDKP